MRINDAFEILGVAKGSSKEVIDKAYKKGLATNHPDKFTDDKEKEVAEAKFKEIQQAYELAKKNPFGVTDGASFSFSFSTNGGGGFTSRTNPEGNPVTFADLSNMARNGMFRRRGEKINATIINISFAESILGCAKKIEIKDKIRCKTCGEKINKDCTFCKGVGVESVVKTYQIKLNPGIVDGETIALVGATLNNSRNLVRIKVESDAELSRSERGTGKDVLSNFDIPLLDALKGTSKTVKTVKGNVTLTIPAGIKNNQELRLRGYGVVGQGDHLVTINVSYPDNKDELIEFLEKDRHGI